MSTPRTSLNSSELIAPCGINCRLCRAYFRDKNPCPGCRSDETRFKSKSCVSCKIKNCGKLASGEPQYCYECNDFPCQALIHLEKRYTATYKLSPLDNLRRIKEAGVDRFVENENSKWACSECGSMLCMHTPECPSCGYRWRS